MNPAMLTLVCLFLLLMSLAGNTCFLSSVLQVLRYTPDFVDNIGRLAAEVKLCSMDDTDEVGLLKKSLNVVY